MPTETVGIASCADDARAVAIVARHATSAVVARTATRVGGGERRVARSRDILRARMADSMTGKRRRGVRARGG